LRTIDISIDGLGKVTLSDSLLGMVGEHNNAKLCVQSKDGFFADADFFRMCFGQYETAALYPVEGVIEYLVPGAVTGSTSKSWQLAGYQFDGQTPLLVKKSEVVTFSLLPSAQPQAEVDSEISGTIEEEIQTLSALVETANGLLQKASAELDQAADRYVQKETGKSLSQNDYTDADKAIVSGHAAEIEALQETCDALEAGKLDLPLYDMANNNANTLTTPGIYATSYAGPQNFPDSNPDAMPLLIVAETGRKPEMSGGTYDFSNAKTLLQILIYKSGTVYSRYKIAGDGDMADWSWSAWSTRDVTVSNSLTSSSTTAALSAAQGKALNDGKVDKIDGKGLSANDYTDDDKAIVSDVGRKWRKLADTTLTEAVGSVTFSEDMDGAAFSCTNFRIFIKYPTIEGQTGKSALKMTSSSLQATHYISFYNALVAGDTYNETIKINLDIFSDIVDVLWFVGQEPAISSPASIMSSIRNGAITCPSGAISDLTIACATSGWTLPVGTEIRIYGR
jgi:hypothetical protein